MLDTRAQKFQEVQYVQNIQYSYSKVVLRLRCIKCKVRPRVMRADDYNTIQAITKQRQHGPKSHNPSNSNNTGLQTIKITNR